jgi:hypothetical protein
MLHTLRSEKDTTFMLDRLKQIFPDASNAAGGSSNSITGTSII